MTMETNRVLRIPSWIAEARRSYTPLVEFSDQGNSSNFFRAYAIWDELAKINPQSDRMKILVVGLGNRSSSLKCTYEPFAIAAYLEANNIDYEMIIIDINKKHIHDVNVRGHIYVDKAFIDTKSVFLDIWNEYLVQTNQKGRLIHEREKGLYFCENVDSHATLEGGIYAAEIPESFRKKRDSGEVMTLESDIATAPLIWPQSTDFVSCRNVLYLMSEAGQKLAIHTMSKYLRRGGIIFGDDYDCTDSPILQDIGGWFDESKQLELRLTLKPYERHFLVPGCDMILEKI